MMTMMFHAAASPVLRYRSRFIDLLYAALIAQDSCKHTCVEPQGHENMTYMQSIDLFIENNGLHRNQVIISGRRQHQASISMH
jgi:hypothetical protein